MSIITKVSSLNVLEAANKRITNVFDSKEKIVLSVSGGKDSICMMSLVYELILKKEITAERLTLVFVDEEAMFDDVIDIVILWRKRFMDLGAKFLWYCLPFLHFNCLNTLEDNETWMIWNPDKKETWVRDIPKFAITSHPDFRFGEDNYQKFLKRTTKEGVSLIGIRTAEGVQRKINISTIFSNKKNESNMNSDNFLFPIYDWSNDDVWRYIKENNLEFPDIYIDLYRSGYSKADMRISQFFSIDTAKVLVNLAEFRPNLMEKVTRREPNAYIASLYFDTEMFRRLKSKGEKIDYKGKVSKLIKQMTVDENQTKRALAKKTKMFIIKNSTFINIGIWKAIYKMLVAGDPKLRSYRALFVLVGKNKKNLSKRKTK